MLTLSQLRKSDPSLANVSDENLEVICSKLYETAQLAFEFWYSSKESSKNPHGLLSSAQSAGTIQIDL